MRQTIPEATYGTKAALQVCKKYQVQEVLCTAWQDNGTETPVDTILPGAALFAHLGFHKDFDQKALEEEFANATGGNLENFLKLDGFDRLFLGEKDNLASENPSKYLLYQDALLGIFDYHLQGKDAAGYYRRLAQELEGCVLEAGCYTRLFAYSYCLAQVLSEKADLGVKIKAAYDAHDLSTLQSISEEKIPHIISSDVETERSQRGSVDGRWETIRIRNSSIFVWAECSHALKAAAEDWRNICRELFRNWKNWKGKDFPISAKEKQLSKTDGREPSAELI